jgi:hypothetical protein
MFSVPGLDVVCSFHFNPDWNFPFSCICLSSPVFTSCIKFFLSFQRCPIDFDLQSRLYPLSLCSVILRAMVSLNQPHLQPTMARSHSSATLLPSVKKASSSAMTASDPDLAKQLYKANVKLAIDDRISGMSAKYEELRSKFTSPSTSPIEICQYLAALTHFVTYCPN